MGKGEGDAAHPPGLDPNNPDDTNRDPNNLNEHVKVMFEDIFGEPEGAHAIDCCWKCAYTCFNCSRNFMYKFLTFFCACPIAFWWGCEFSQLVFSMVWFYTPMYRYEMIRCTNIRKFYKTYVDCCLGPLCETCSICFSSFKK